MNEKMWKSSRIRFYGELNDFLSRDMMGKTLTVCFIDRGTLKDFIESLGVPHPEIALILVNGEPSGFDRIMKDGDFISVYPEFFSIPVEQAMQLKPPYPEERRFILDVHLGRLAKYLRMLGFDTLYRNDLDDPELAEISSRDGRILLTRDTGLLRRNEVRLGCWIRNTLPKYQILEIAKRFDLVTRARPFTRCLDCNTPFVPISKEDALPSIPIRAGEYYNEFQYCRSCRKVFWKGSHYERMRKMFDGWREKE